MAFVRRQSLAVVLPLLQVGRLPVEASHAGAQGHLHVLDQVRPVKVLLQCPLRTVQPVWAVRIRSRRNWGGTMIRWSQNTSTSWPPNSAPPASLNKPRRRSMVFASVCMSGVSRVLGCRPWLTGLAICSTNQWMIGSVLWASAISCTWSLSWVSAPPRWLLQLSGRETGGAFCSSPIVPAGGVSTAIW